MNDLSPEAETFLAACLRSDEPIDFSRIAEIRTETRVVFAAAAERAIARHALTREEITLAGVECELIRSASVPTTNGTLVYLFGGGFVAGCPHNDLPIIGALAERCGVEVVAPRYRLAPEFPAPAAADDCMAVYDAVAASAPARLLLAGESAGGNLALVVAQGAVSAGIRVPDAMALLSPAADLRVDEHLYEPTHTRDPTLSPTRPRDVWSPAYVAGKDPGDPSVSPVFGEMRGLPSTIITTGTRDMLMAMCLRLDRAMRRAGVEVDTRVWNGLWHVFECYDSYPEAAESLQEIAQFLNARS